MKNITYYWNEYGLRKDVKEKLVNIIVGLGFASGFIAAIAPIAGA